MLHGRLHSRLHGWLHGWLHGRLHGWLTLVSIRNERLTISSLIHTALAASIVSVDRILHVGGSDSSVVGMVVSAMVLFLAPHDLLFPAIVENLSCAAHAQGLNQNSEDGCDDEILSGVIHALIVIEIPLVAPLPPLVLSGDHDDNNDEDKEAEAGESRDDVEEEFTDVCVVGLDADHDK